MRAHTRANHNNYNSYYLDEILEEEQRWADEANAERENAKKVLAAMYMAGIILGIINVLILVICLSKNKKYKQRV